MTSSISGNIIDQQCLSLLRRRQHLCYDPIRKKFYASKLYLSPLAKCTAGVLLCYLKKMNQSAEDDQQNDRLIEAANIFLQRHISWIDKPLDLNAAKDDPFIMHLITIDRYLARSRFKNTPIEESQVSDCFLTQGAKQQLQKWQNILTKHGKKYQTHEKIFMSNNSAQAFIRHPQQIDFIKKHFIDKHVAYRNHQLAIDFQTKDISVLYEGEYRQISDIMRTHQSARQRLYCEDQRVFYKDRLGFVRCEPNNREKEDPEHFVQLPIHRTNPNRKHQDWRLEIRCAVSNKWVEGNHSWLVLRNPNGQVRRFGWFWREGDEPAYFRLLRPEIGEFHADGDRYDYYVQDSGAITKTCITIDQEKHDAIIHSVEEFQNRRDERIFNPVYHNCSWFTHYILKKHVDVDIPIQRTLLEFFFGIDLRKNFLVRYVPPVRVAAFFVCYALSIARNFTYLLLGARFWGEKNQRMFQSFFSLFNPKKGMPYNPRALKAWQQKVHEINQRKIAELGDDVHNRDEEVHRIVTSIPPEVLRPKPTWKEYILDVFFPILETNDYFS